MNVLAIDETGRLDPADLLREAADLPAADHTAVLRPSGAGWVVRFADGAEVVTHAAPEGVLCGALLSADRFDRDDELLVLFGDPAGWPAHLDRLAGGSSLPFDAFFSFDAPAGPGAAPGDDPADSYPAGPQLIWVRLADQFYRLVQSAIRKDARAGDGFSPAALLRELYLAHAAVGVGSADVPVSWAHGRGSVQVPTLAALEGSACGTTASTKW